MKKTILVKCTYFLPIEIDLDEYHWYDGETEEDHKEHVRFSIEDNGCPGTGIVGADFEAVRATTDSCCCWACNLKGKNEIVDWDYEE